MRRPEQWPAALHQLPPTLPPAVREAAELLALPEMPVRQLGTESVADALLMPLSGVAFLLGHRNALADKDSLNTMADEVAAMVVRRFGSLTIPEICLALRRGASGEWRTEGELLLVALPVIAGWLTSYQIKARADAIAALQAATEALPANRQLPPPDPTRDYPERVTEWAATVAAGRPLPWDTLDLGDVVYSWLARIGAFRSYFTACRRARMLRTVCWQLYNEPVSSRDEGRRRREFRQQARRGTLEGRHAIALTQACRKFLLREWLHAQARRGPSGLLPWLEELAEAARQ